jgi:hypothetical protein
MAATVQITLSAECPELQDGLQARIHDPLWLLARQWQFGEFKGEDTGSPAAAQVVIETAPISRYQPGPASSSNGIQSYSPLALALETLVEREAVIKDNIPNWRWATEAGLHLIRFLNVEGVGTYRSVFLKSTYVLKPTPQQRQTHDSDSQRFLSVVGGRVVDGTQLYRRLASLRDRNALAEFLQESPFERIAPADRPQVIRAVTAWLAWYLTPFSLWKNIRRGNSAGSSGIPGRSPRLVFLCCTAGNVPGRRRRHVNRYHGISPCARELSRHAVPSFLGI